MATEATYRRLAANALLESEKAVNADQREAWLKVSHGYHELADAAAGKVRLLIV